MATTDTARIEAPVTLKTYLMCAFAAFGGIFFGYDSGWINGVLAMNFVVNQYTGMDAPPSDAPQAAKDAFVIPAYTQSLVVSILSCGTFFGAIIAGDLADLFGRRTTIIVGCVVFIVGVILQVASTGVPLMVPGRLIAGFGVGFVSAIIILYMSEISPKRVRGAIVSGYQFCITIGLLLASCVCYATEGRTDTGSYRIPIAVQFIWALILGIGLLFLPESPRYFVKRGKIDRATATLARLRSQPLDSELVQQELAEIVANHEYELKVIPQGNYFTSWLNCFRGSLFKPNSNLRRTILGTSLQMMQQWTGVNFVFYFGTNFFKSLGTVQNPFIISLITTLVNVCSTPISFWAIERLGRRPLLIWGAFGMVVCQFIVAITGTVTQSPSALSAMIAFICIYIFFFASTWGPGAWVVIGEIYPLPIRARGVALSTASNWLWNCVRILPPFSHAHARISLEPAWLTCMRSADHRRHHPLHGQHGPGQSGRARLLHLGLAVRDRLRLRLLPHLRDQGPLARTGRQAHGRDVAAQLVQVEAHHDLRGRDGAHGQGHAGARDPRGRGAQGLGCLKEQVLFLEESYGGCWFIPCCFFLRGTLHCLNASTSKRQMAVGRQLSHVVAIALMQSHSRKPLVPLIIAVYAMPDQQITIVEYLSLCGADPQRPVHRQATTLAPAWRKHDDGIDDYRCGVHPAPLGDRPIGTGRVRRGKLAPRRYSI